MSKLPIIVSATIVLIFFSGWSWADPSAENLSIASSPPVHYNHLLQTEDAHYYPYHQALTVKFGQSFGVAPLGDEGDVWGMEYQFPKFLSPRLEAGAEVQPDAYGDIYVGIRKIFREKTYFRPSLRLALDNYVNPKNNLATFIDIYSYYLRLSAAVEYTFWRPWSIRLEAEGLLGLKKMRTQVTVGLSHGW